MIAFVRGTLAGKAAGSVILDCQGIGYEIFVTEPDWQRLTETEQPVQLYTHMHISENTGVTLYGFLQPDDLSLFRLLITVSGVGPKMAQNVLSLLPGNSLRVAILSDDTKSIAKANGIAAKKAAQIVLALKDKVSIEETIEQMSSTGAVSTGREASMLAKPEVADAVLALEALGFTHAEAVKAVRSVAFEEGMTAEDILQASLKNM